MVIKGAPLRSEATTYGKRRGWKVGTRQTGRKEGLRLAVVRITSSRFIE